MDTFILDQDKLIGLGTEFLFKISLCNRLKIRDQYVRGEGNLNSSREMFLKMKTDKRLMVEARPFLPS